VLLQAGRLDWRKIPTGLWAREGWQDGAGRTLKQQQHRSQQLDKVMENTSYIVDLLGNIPCLYGKV
jgi:hypothetical protein